MRAVRIDDEGARFDAQQSDLYRPARQRGARVGEGDRPRASVRPSLRLEQPKALDLRGRLLYLSAPRVKPERNWTLLTELGVLSGRPVVAIARLWARLLEKAEGKATVARESWPAALSRTMGDSGVLVVLPTDDGFLGMSQWFTVVIALRAGKAVLVVDPANRLIDPEAAGLCLTDGRDTAAVVRCTWQHRPVPLLRLPVDPREASANGKAHTNGSKARMPEELPFAWRTAASLARGKEAKRVAKEIRTAAGFGKGRHVDDATRRKIEAATAAVIARPLTEFMTEDTR